MNCQRCGCKTAVIDSRPFDDNTVKRQRECKKCRYRQSTYESFPDPELMAQIDHLIEAIEKSHKLMKEPIKDLKAHVRRSSGVVEG